VGAAGAGLAVGAWWADAGVRFCDVGLGAQRLAVTNVGDAVMLPFDDVIGLTVSCRFTAAASAVQVAVDHGCLLGVAEPAFVSAQIEDLTVGSEHDPGYVGID